MFGRYLFLGITTSLFASAGAIMYGTFFNQNLFDFSMVVGPVAIVATCTMVSVFGAIMSWLAEKLLRSWGEFVFNFFFSVGTMASILGPINFQFPQEVLEKVHEVNGPDTEGFFPSFAIPMHFFPLLVWFALKPLFFRKR